MILDLQLFSWDIIYMTDFPCGFVVKVRGSFTALIHGKGSVLNFGKIHLLGLLRQRHAYCLLRELELTENLVRNIK